MSQKPAWMAPRGTPWKPGPTRVVYENRWISVSEQIATAPTGNPALYGLVAFKNRALAVLPIHATGEVVLVGQHRLPFGDYSWELPEGGGAKQEDPLEGARRELAEETGLAAGQWREILRMQLSNSVTDELAIGYLATDLTPAPGVHHADDTEEIAVAKVPFRQALEGHIQDALTVAMLLRGYHMAREGHLAGALARVMLG